MVARGASSEQKGNARNNSSAANNLAVPSFIPRFVIFCILIPIFNPIRVPYSNNLRAMLVLTPHHTSLAFSLFTSDLHTALTHLFFDILIGDHANNHLPVGSVRRG